jgi:hypothetical protein
VSGGFSPRQAEDLLPQRRIVSVAAACITVTLVAIAAAWFILRADRPRHVEAPPPDRAPAEIGHVEQSLVESTRRGLDQRDRQREALEHYRWIDRTRGTARIPIERAIDLTVEQSR